MSRTRAPGLAALAGVAVLALAACGSGAAPVPAAAGVPAEGHRLIEQFGCGACHRIAGVSGANGTVGPDLRDFDAQRSVGGVLPRTPANVVRWLLDPPALSPRTIMPDLGLTPAQARDITAYLYTQ